MRIKPKGLFAARTFYRLGKNAHGCGNNQPKALKRFNKNQNSPSGKSRFYKNVLYL
jgi:hypothetical protein